MTTDEYAFGWLVLGEGLAIVEAQNWIIHANIYLREAWAGEQMQALRGFHVLIDKVIAGYPLPVLVT